MRLIWRRGNDKIPFNRPSVHFVLGARGAGKSSLLEHLGELYLQKGSCVLDLFGSHDGEGLAWLRSPYAKDKRILLLHGDNVDIDAPCETKNVSALTKPDFESYDIIISANPCYLSHHDEFLQASRITDMIYRRRHYKRLVYMVVREAANLYYSRMKISDNQSQAKAEMTYLIREGRHCGLALGLDTLRFYSVDVDIRSLADYVYIKSQGMAGLTKDIKWLYSMYDPNVVRHMPPQFFFLLTKMGAVGTGRFPYPKWHKEEKEDILRSVGIRVEYGTPVEVGDYRGTHKTVGDEEHADIISLYMDEEMGMGAIAGKLERSTATIKRQIDNHNKAIERSSFCTRCRRTGSALEAELASRA